MTPARLHMLADVHNDLHSGGDKPRHRAPSRNPRADLEAFGAEL